MSAPNDNMKDLAEAAVEVFGDCHDITSHACRSGTWLFLGALLAIGAMRLVHVGAAAVALISFAAGWALNERERRRSRQRVHDREGSWR